VGREGNQVDEYASDLADRKFRRIGVVNKKVRGGPTYTGHKKALSEGGGKVEPAREGSAGLVGVAESQTHAGKAPNENLGVWRAKKKIRVGWRRHQGNRRPEKRGPPPPTETRKKEKVAVNEWSSREKK